MRHRMPPSIPAALGVGAALVVALIWWLRPHEPVVERAVEATVAVRISRHDALGIPSNPVTLRERAKVRALVEALDVDAHPPVPCPPDYATADVGIVLTGRDVYSRRNVYVWGLGADAGSPNVLVVSSAGCRGGPPANASAVRELIADAGADASR